MFVISHLKPVNTKIKWHVTLDSHILIMTEPNKLVELNPLMGSRKPSVY
jgi:hypothetical protein